MHNYRFSSGLNLLTIGILLIGCGGKVDSILLQTSLQNAQSAMFNAERFQADSHTKERYSRAAKLLDAARIAQRAGNGVQSLELAFQAQMQAKISEIQARQHISQVRIDETNKGIHQATRQEMDYEIQAAQARQAVAEELTRRALGRANRAQEEAIAAKIAADAARSAAQRSILQNETESVISEAKQLLNLARETDAMSHTPADYRAAEKLIDEAISYLDLGNFDKATDLASQARNRANAARIASLNAIRTAKSTKVEAYTEAKISIAQAEMEIARAENVYASVHAADLFQLGTATLEEAISALKAEQYDRVVRLAGQVEQAAREAYTASEAIDRQRRVQEVIEEELAQAKDAIFKAEERIEQERKTNVSHLAPILYKQAETLLVEARLAIANDDFQSTTAAAEQSLEVLNVAITNSKRVELVENRIVEAASSIASAEIDQNEQGILIRLSGNLFNSGSTTLNTDFLPHLKQLAQIIKDFSDYYVRIEGHSDASGSASANLALTEKRARACKQYLIDMCDAPGERLTTVGLGESVPIAAETNERGVERNRRIDTIILTRQ